MVSCLSQGWQRRVGSWGQTGEGNSKYQAQRDVEAGNGHQAGHPHRVLPVDQERVSFVDERLFKV